ncbi:hypothetical protein [Oligella urethralis]|uniref:Uncharacterized protein n=1 Tax=Oligella urethralis DNF00040 TaxID=1401065 RepID=A0A096AIG9_9BURK|nr:hypothetical protein [Oligella urethralis]KGF30502.1 hypothetical protein HMPREF2130_06740 [Oligella urethralis DNF00040]SUA58158.1 Uncharacterised protein [Oligella urethralis]
MKKVQCYKLEVWGFGENPDHECLFSFKPNAGQLAGVISGLFPSCVDTSQVAASLLKKSGDLVTVGESRLRFEDEIIVELYIED